MKLVILLLLTVTTGFFVGRFSVKLEQKLLSDAEKISKALSAVQKPQLASSQPAPGREEVLSQAQPQIESKPINTPAPKLKLADATAKALYRLPVSTLREIVRQREEQLVKTNIDKRFPSDFSTQDHRDVTARISRELRAKMQESSYWTATADVSLGQRHQELVLIAQYYPESTEAPEMSAASREATSVCYMVHGFAPGVPDAQLFGLGSCHGNLRKKGNRLVLTTGLEYADYSLVQRYVDHLAVELPHGEYDSGTLELKDSTTDRWTVASQGLRWKPISKEDAEAMQKRLRDGR